MILEEVKRNFYKPVIYNGVEYTLTECILKLNKETRQFVYSLTLLDKNQNSTITVPMEKVEIRS